ncbi:MAG: hypothetical protein ACJAZK_000891 [Psychroserpens sp.]|jgi:hypothetical protein|uniref:DUF6122 family protein n=1 Tax=Psychroserpens sp. TaxID=2020870 RepID=UPI0039E4CB5E
MLQTTIHYSIHFLVPILIALLFFREHWKLASIIMLSAIIIDLDHLLANPVFDPTRCSINFHPLHSYYAIAIYIILTFIKKTRIIGLGLLIHMLADWADCLMM